MRRGTPETHEAGEFQQMTIGGLTVYVHNSLSEFPGLQIDADGGFFGQKLVLKGLPQEKSGCC